MSLYSVNFYGYEDVGNGLPLIQHNVLSGASFPVYIKGRDLNLTKDGEKNRRAYLSIVRTLVGR